MTRFPTTKNEIIRYCIEEEEGGWKYTDHKDDPDAGTYAGVTFAAYRYYISEETEGLQVSSAQFKEIANDEDENVKRQLQNDIIKIYDKKYYSPLRLDELPDYLRCMLFSIGVNLGIDDAGEILQKVVNLETPYNADKLIVDGKVGPKTVAAANQFLVFNMELIRLCAKHRIFYEWMTRYNSLVVANAKAWHDYAEDGYHNRVTQGIKPRYFRAVFLQGWFNRAVKYIKPE